MGWVDCCSQLAQISSSSSPPTIFCTVKSPLVMVPVLSMTTALILLMASMDWPPLNRMPRLLPAPIPAKKASGTLRTSAQGQLMTRKVRAVYTHLPQSPVTREGTIAVSTAAPTTMGV